MSKYVYYFTGMGGRLGTRLDAVFNDIEDDFGFGNKDKW